MWHLAAAAPLAPLLAVQALRTARRAERLPEAAGPRHGEAGNGRPLRLLILGDSAAAGVGVSCQDQALAGRLVHHLSAGFRVHWQLVARTGATTAEALGWIDPLVPTRFDAAVLSLGVNDVTSGLMPRQWIARQARLHARLRDRLGVKAIFCTQLPPMRHFPLLPQPLRWVVGRQAEAFDAALRAHCAATPGLHHLAFALPPDPTLMARDGYHPGPVVYDIWAQAAARAVQAAFS